MSHRDSCPTEWEARREGERAAEWGEGRYRNPYDERNSDSQCEEAARAWDRGHRYAEERREEESAEARARERHEQERALEAEAHARYQDEQYAEMESAHWERVEREALEGAPPTDVSGDAQENATPK